MYNHLTYKYDQQSSLKTYEENNILNLMPNIFLKQNVQAN